MNHPLFKSEFLETVNPVVLPLIHEIRENMSRIEVDIEKNSVQTFKEAFQNKHFNVTDDFWKFFEQGDSIEAWTVEQKFLYRVGAIEKISKTSIHDLYSKDWRTLFERDEVVSDRVVNAWIKSFETGALQKNVTGFHEVTEILTGIKLNIKIKAIAPFSLGGVKVGAVALIRLNQNIGLKIV